ncbi:LuxR C-terminal-related transcriptional regulator [Oscillatoria nigro-viridis]|uniref:LuxR C-terminal-related transcriptional regulator n=1 Tax=Phormidium nigroviride TaxID=482564 RepID=UPI000684A8E0|nr:LuxR C-terminal-related transcriptional regulator [Oscillatoria nigro-viridis]
MGRPYLRPISAAQSFSLAALELLRLTKHEAPVLFWIAKDKSNASIARVLGCTEGTVRKHLENLYKKLYKSGWMP